MKKSSTFFEMSISEGMKKTINDIGFMTPTPIQEKSIPHLLAGLDLLGQAQTGTGKTAAFSIPLIELVDEGEGYVQALVVCPTRELCLQVCQEVQRLSAHKESLGAVALYGGQAIEQQFRLLKVSQPKIIVATPGRLFDHLRRKSVELSRVRMIVLDEADEMLDMGFRPEIEEIFAMLPEENQRIFFSATMAKNIKDLACSYLREPKIIKTETAALTVNTISQSYYRIRGKEKVDLLCRVLDLKDPKLAVVFCNAKSSVDEVVDAIQRRGFDAGVLHGDLSQAQRDRVMARFRAGVIRVLVATDVAARGLDIENVELVVNFHLPHDPEDYVHRIGRTGRAGRTGCAISLVEPR
ncbi:MAG TPA: DEAD/DEAH box helicase, partial [Myxococcota bacterium]|nr:DEAD/DEAH box helicase [Myxococcota bacterium]